MTTPSRNEDLLFALQATKKAILTMLFQQYRYAEQLSECCYLVGDTKEGVYCAKINSIVIDVKSDKIRSGAIPSEFVVTEGSRLAVYSCTEKKFVIPFEFDAEEIVPLPEHKEINVLHATTRSLYALKQEGRWSVVNTKNGLQTDFL